MFWHFQRPPCRAGTSPARAGNAHSPRVNEKQPAIILMRSPSRSRGSRAAPRSCSRLYSHVSASLLQDSVVFGAVLLGLSALAVVQGDGVSLEFDEQMQTRIVATGATEQL